MLECFILITFFTICIMCICQCLHFELKHIHLPEISFLFSFSGQPFLFWVSSYMSLWSNILFNCAVLINLIVAFFYPFMDTVPSKYRSYFVSQDVALYCARYFQFLTCFRQVQECTLLPAGQGWAVLFVCLETHVHISSVTCKVISSDFPIFRLDAVHVVSVELCWWGIIY
jgi:hypothetical protein